MDTDAIPFARNCPINERTGDGMLVGRCWFFMQDGHTCPRHGDVSEAIAHYLQTGELTAEPRLKHGH